MVLRSLLSTFTFDKSQTFFKNLLYHLHTYWGSWYGEDNRYAQTHWPIFTKCCVFCKTNTCFINICVYLWCNCIIFKPINPKWWRFYFPVTFLIIIDVVVWSYYWKEILVPSQLSLLITIQCRQKVWIPPLNICCFLNFYWIFVKKHFLWRTFFKLFIIIC